MSIRIPQLPKFTNLPAEQLRWEAHHVVVASQEDNWESSNVEKSDNDLEMDGEVSGIIGFRGGKWFKEGLLFPIQQFN